VPNLYNYLFVLGRIRTNNYKVKAEDNYLMI
jgi:hypothetical protein